MNRTKISHGLTFKGYISAIGSVFFVIGLILTIVLIIHKPTLLTLSFPILSTIIGAIFFISLRGVIIDFDKKSIKPYFDILIAKLGTWTPLDQFEMIALKYTNTSQRMNSRGSSTTYITKSFDIVLTSKNKKDLIIKEFINYDKAKNFLNEYSRLLDKLSVDTYELMIESIQERKQQNKK